MFYSYVDGVLWECKLCGTIVPTKCKLRPGTVRVEVKLKKQDIESWSDFSHKDGNKVLIICIYVYTYVHTYILVL